MNFGLREKKHAQTKLAILTEFITHLESGKPIDELSNKEICNRVNISEATFYNYFPQKKDILQYMFKLWSIEILWLIEKEKPGLKGLEFLKEIAQARHIRGSHSVKVLSEILSVVSKEGIDPEMPIPSDAEIFYAFPNYKGILNINRNKNYIQIYEENLNIAKANGEVKKDLDVEAATYSLLGMIIGPLVFLKNAPNADEKIQRIANWHADLFIEAIRAK